MTLAGRNVLVGVSGGIAAYKAAELVRLFVRADAQVRVMMTRGAQAFVTPLTFQSLSQKPVATDTFDLSEELTIGHIALADAAELVILAPATAHLIARLAHGLADDVVTTVALARSPEARPLLVAPAMNVNMWRHAATQQNIATLKSRGAIVVGPDEGDLACGWVGAGRMAEPAEIFARAVELLGSADLAGVRITISAGPTHEPVDAVRFLGNRSSGKMGFALATRARSRGADVTLIAGPVALATPAGVRRIDVSTAAQMKQAVDEAAATSDVVIMAAAVADYAPQNPASGKLKKRSLGDGPAIALRANPDILAELGARIFARRPILVGFAAETEALVQSARQKLAEKKCDLVVANDVSEPDAGFGSDRNRVVLVDGMHDQELPLLPKSEVADRILDRVRTLAAARP